MNLGATLQARFFRWALRGPTPEAAPVRLTRERVFVLPTAFGAGYAALLLLMLVAAINYELSLAHALVFFLASLGVVCMFHSFRNLAELRIAAGRTLPAFAGDDAHFSVLLGNPSDRPRPALGLALTGGQEVAVELPARASLEVTLKAPTQTRGWLPMPRLRLATTYPLGLIRAWAYAVPDLRCLVYPSPHPEALAPSMTAATNTGASGRDEGLEDFSGLRMHRPADPLRHVAWKAAARSEQAPLLTKLFIGGQAQTVWLDFDRLPADLGLETKLSMLTRGVCDARAGGLACGLRLPDQTLEAAAGETHYAACLAALALFGIAPA